MSSWTAWPSRSVMLAKPWPRCRPKQCLGRTSKKRDPRSQRPNLCNCKLNRGGRRELGRLAAEAPGRGASNPCVGGFNGLPEESSSSAVSCFPTSSGQSFMPFPLSRTSASLQVQQLRVQPGVGEVGIEVCCTECSARSAAISVVVRSLKIPFPAPDMGAQSDGMLARQLGFWADLGAPLFPSQWLTP